jgi:hypothetical protein
MIDRINEQPFCQTRVSGSTLVNADCFDVFPFIEDKEVRAKRSIFAHLRKDLDHSGRCERSEHLPEHQNK